MMSSRELARKPYSLACRLMLFVTLAPTFSVYASECRQGEIQDVRLFPSEGDHSDSGSGTAKLNSSDSYEIIVRVGENLYIALYQPKWKWSFKPKDLTVGDNVPVRIEQENLFLKCGTSKEIKVRIVETKPAR
jgi:hypothetical protein